MLFRTVLAVFLTLVFAAPVFAEESSMIKSSVEQDATQSMNPNLQPSLSKVNLNTASAKELMKVKGLNASKARAIVAYRKKNGEFKSVDELTKVKGFRNVKTVQLKDIQDQLTLE